MYNNIPPYTKYHPIDNATKIPVIFTHFRLSLIAISAEINNNNENNIWIIHHPILTIGNSKYMNVNPYTSKLNGSDFPKMPIPPNTLHTVFSSPNIFTETNKEKNNILTTPIR